MIRAGLTRLQDKQVIQRIWDRDHTVWQDDPREITNRLGWLDIADRMTNNIPRIQSFREQLQDEGINQALLMGMGGSSLAPEVFSRIFGQEDPPLTLEVLDSTDPAAVRDQTGRLDPERTLFIVATKSGTTVETLSFFKYFYRWTVDQLGEERAGQHFVGITDPDSKLIQLGDRYQFRDIFVNDPHIGGRYSALSFFGLVPAALSGVDLERLLDRARDMARRCRSQADPENNPGAVLGTLLGVFAREGRDKATFFTNPTLKDFPNWIEQLLAESTGKSGTGILPVVGEPVSHPESYGKDRVFIYLTLEGQTIQEPDMNRLRQEGHPVLEIELSDRYDLGGQYFLWEFAAAVAGYHLNIHPFNQPNVESAKVRAREMVQAYEQDGTLPEIDAAPLSRKALSAFISEHQQDDGSYIALQAFLPPTGDIEGHLQSLRAALRDQFQLPTTLGFGPRFLHSTGQLHKGDAGKGLFVQFTSQPAGDIPIPDSPQESTSSIEFGTLKLAQALGDARALQEAGRPVIRFNLGTDPRHELQEFIQDY